MQLKKLMLYHLKPDFECNLEKLMISGQKIDISGSLLPFYIFSKVSVSLRNSLPNHTDFCFPVRFFLVNIGHFFFEQKKQKNRTTKTPEKQQPLTILTQEDFYYFADQWHQLMVNWWFRLVVWIPTIPSMKGVVTYRYP